VCEPSIKPKYAAIAQSGQSVRLVSGGSWVQILLAAPSMNEVTVETYNRFLDIWLNDPKEYEYEKKYNRLGLAFCRHFRMKDDDFSQMFNVTTEINELSKLVAHRIILN
jgi:hypothetical protein